MTRSIGRGSPNVARDAAIVAAVVAGESCAAVARRNGVSRERVRQILFKAVRLGLDPPPRLKSLGWYKEWLAQRDAAKREQDRQRFVARFGFEPPAAPP